LERELEKDRRGLVATFLIVAAICTLLGVALAVPRTTGLARHVSRIRAADGRTVLLDEPTRPSP
jgi:hypothetical protein